MLKNENNLVQESPEYPAAMASSVIEILDSQFDNAAVRERVNNLFSDMAQANIVYTSEVLYYVLKEKEIEHVAYLINSLNIAQAIEVLALLGKRKDWRNNKVMDLMSMVMKNWEIDDIKIVIAKLPRVPISNDIQKKK